MCRVTSIDGSVATKEVTLPVLARGENKPISSPSSQSNHNGLRVLICSENVPPQVNGIARRIGKYADGLRALGCDVGECMIL